jgi:hypothetical protein
MRGRINLDGSGFHFGRGARSLGTDPSIFVFGFSTLFVYRVGSSVGSETQVTSRRAPRRAAISLTPLCKVTGQSEGDTVGGRECTAPWCHACRQVNSGGAGTWLRHQIGSRVSPLRSRTASVRRAAPGHRVRLRANPGVALRRRASGVPSQPVVAPCARSPCVT